MYPILPLGPFELRSYGIIVGLSFLAGLWLGKKEAASNGLDPAHIDHFALYALLGGVFGARLYFIALSDPVYYLQNPGEILAVWHGGLGVIGALAGGFLAAVWYCRRNQIPLLKFADSLAPAVALGQALGQFACLANGDSYGRKTDLSWAITYTDPRSMAPLNVPLHPIEIYEMGAYFLVFLLVWTTRKRVKVEGFSLWTYLAAYGVARFVMEFFRGQPAILAGGVPAAQVFSAGLILASLAGFLLLGKSRS